MEIKVTRSKKEIENNSGSISMKNLTAGEVLALLNALKERSKISPVAHDIYVFLYTALKDWDKVVENHE